jgi:hypothetical protein
VRVRVESLEDSEGERKLEGGFAGRFRLIGETVKLGRPREAQSRGCKPEAGAGNPIVRYQLCR